MSVLFKKYSFVKQENLEEFLKEIGIKTELIKAASAIKPEIQLVQNGDNTYTFNTTSAERSSSVTFTLNEEFEKDTADGRTGVKSVITFDGNKMIETQKGDKPVTIERAFYDDKVIVKCIARDVVATRTFKAV